MTRADALHRLADVSSLLIGESDLAGVLVRTIAEAVHATGADSGGLLVLAHGEELELLSATSHRAADLETWQAATGVGPCRECMAQLAHVSRSVEEVMHEWPEFGQVMADAGYAHLLATPLRWRGRALGGLNLFWQRAPTESEETVTIAQIFSDALTLAILTIRPIAEDETRERLELALKGRVVIEQAKGVLAHEEHLPMELAYARLLAIADERGEPLSQAARFVLDQAQRRDQSTS